LDFVRQNPNPNGPKAPNFGTQNYKKGKDMNDGARVQKERYNKEETDIHNLFAQNQTNN
jgi:hypothetical protein